MINSITLQEVTSYSPEKPTKIKIDGNKINLFYGLNGSGKSTIGKLLQAPSLPEYKKCKIEHIQNEDEIIVYNQEFIRENFYTTDHLNGIFTLSKENQEAEKAIESAKEKIIEINDKKNQTINKLNDISNKKSAEEKNIKDIVWSAKSTHENTDLDFCLNNYRNNKSKFLDKVKSSSGVTKKNFETLTAEARELLNSNNNTIENISQLNINMGEDKDFSILSEIILGSQDSYLSDLIKNLGNSDWVKSGMAYMAPNNPCPFCQQTIDTAIYNAVKQLFDDTYEKKISLIQSLKIKYEKETDNLKSRLLNLTLTIPENIDTHNLQDKANLLLGGLSKNLEKIKNKLINPSIPIKLVDTTSLLSDLENAISKTNNKIDLFNNKIKNADQHLNRIQSDFWILLNIKYTESMDHSDQKIKKFKEESDALTKEKYLLEEEKDQQSRIISENQKKITNIEHSINNINQRLIGLGINSFQIKKASSDNQRYKIIRTNENETNIYKTLSEGEKTLISFLYFIEYISGSKSDTHPAIIENRIIVIDDPISSLSHNYIYDIASIIHHNVFNSNFKQVFLLTHNLFFFHELLMLKNSSNKCPKGYKLYRVSKSDFSKINPMERNELQNDYQMYWQIIKDCSVDSSYSQMLPNAMRNILEHYFNFVHKKEELRNILDNLGDSESEFKPLFIYINRESHSDSINLINTNTINTSQYIEKFKQIFQETGFLGHYNNMMGLKEEVKQ
ncbi:AAA family ATPase [Oceanospirillum sediminis]|uniref:AAA family ATPase n=1 Tax=Oceanospirillum sediminis TaxID=2760088 RepID=A0A839IKP8_9GAMM|nr:AAA family ATPase [Oceanospirillum sediminis]MBB1485077.1 AAA family ATPase [Oceanospirillum sediminis]